MFRPLNYKLLGVSFVLLVVGYICLGQGPVNNPLSLSVAPVILVAVYCVLLPIAIVIKGKESKRTARRNADREGRLAQLVQSTCLTSRWS